MAQGCTYGAIEMDNEIRVGDTVEVVQDPRSWHCHKPDDANAYLEVGDRIVITHVNRAANFVGYACEGGTCAFGKGHNAINSEWVKKVDVGPPRCTCPTAQLMAQGCICGGT